MGIIGKRSKNVVNALLTVALTVLGIATIFVGVRQFKESHFRAGTNIQGVNCSFLTVEDAVEKLEQTICEKVSFTVVALPEQQGDEKCKEYLVPQEQLEAFQYQIVNKALIEEVLKAQQAGQEERNITITELFLVDDEAVKNYLSTIPELNGSCMRKVEDASLYLNSNLRFDIGAEVYGNEVNFEQACEVAISSLMAGKSQVDFSSITKEEPIFKQNSVLLENARKELNAIMETSMKFELPDGTTVTLDDTIIQEWIETTDNFPKVTINIEGNLFSFLDYLADEVQKADTEFVFHATDFGDIVLPIDPSARALLNKEEQYNWIVSHIGWKQEELIQLCYARRSVRDRMSSYIETDISRQNTWIYVNKEEKLDTPVVTGNETKGYITPNGIFFLAYKQHDAILTDHKTYWVQVENWACFEPNRGIGFHDAKRSKFGGNIYLINGSHACINMPLEASRVLYEIINSDMPIIIYKSENFVAGSMIEPATKLDKKVDDAKNVYLFAYLKITIKVSKTF